MPRAVVFAYNAFGCLGVESLLGLGVEIPLVLTHRDHPGERCWWPSVAALCARHGIPHEFDADLKDPALAARLAALRPDLVCSFYFRHMIPERLLAAPLGAWNLHGSLLPAFRGRSPVNWQLVHGVRRSGVTIHRMLRRADAGEILAQQAVEVHPDQDAIGLTRQLMAITPGLCRGAFGALLAGTARPWAQDESQATCFGGRRPEDGRIDWSWPARRVHDLVRAVAPPWPGAFTALGGRRLAVRRSAVADDAGVHGAPGTVLADGSVACGAGRLWLLDAGLDPDDAPAAMQTGETLG